MVRCDPAPGEKQAAGGALLRWRRAEGHPELVRGCVARVDGPAEGLGHRSKADERGSHELMPPEDADVLDRKSEPLSRAARPPSPVTCPRDAAQRWASSASFALCSRSRMEANSRAWSSQNAR